MAFKKPEVHYRPYRSPQLALSSARANQSPGSQPTSLKYILTLSSHLRLGLRKDLFLPGFTAKALYAFLHCPIRAIRVLLISVDLRFLIMLDKQYNACNFLHSPVIPYLLAPNNFLSNLLSNTLNLCSSLNVRYQVSQPYNTTSNIIILYVLTFSFWKAGGTIKFSQVNNNMNFPCLLCV